MINKKKISKLDEEELLKQFFQTHESAFFGELYRRYIPLVYGLCLKYLENEELAHDAVMDIFEDLLGKIAQYEIQNFNSWLYSVAKNHCLHVIRKEKRTIFVNIEDAGVENNDFFTLIDKQETEEKNAALKYCMTTLPDEQQTSINYFYLEEKSYADIVVLTGFALNQVKSYIQNGKRNLKNCITKVLAKN
ncbi:MAG: sigma-70 family RNA polymerase sigma factor [Dysgonamonadaceae bacterium]|nr:sigma-70 family RNA polymerase sigma factor [Dysgonamonadaceae bacterium]